MYSQIPPEELTAFLLKHLSGDFSPLTNTSDILLANSVGTLGNMARNAALRAGFHESVRASTLDLQCGGTYEALRLGSALCLAKKETSVIIGGMESNSLMPHRKYARSDPRYSMEGEFAIAEFSPYHSNDLKEAAAKMVEQFEIGKEEMLQWTLRSHSRAADFSPSELYQQHVIPYPGLSSADESIRPGLTRQLLIRAAEEPLIDRTNTAHFHDGAGVALLSSEENLRAGKIVPLAKVLHVTIAGVSPDRAPAGCIEATRLLLKETGLSVHDIDLFEVNESFAVKPLAFSLFFGIDQELINVFGGNLAMGHPFAASGIINILNMVLALKEKRRKFGLVTAGIAGGYGAAVLLENME